MKPFFIKQKLVFLFFVMIFISLISCKNCSHCIIKDSSGNIIKDYGEKCGTSTDMNDYENSAKKDAVQYGGTCTCN